MVFEIVHVAALDQHAEKNSSPKTLHLSASLSMISKQQLPDSSTVVSYIHIAGLGNVFEKRY